MLGKQCFIHIYQLQQRNKNLVYVWSGSQIQKYIFKISMKTNIWQLGQKQHTEGSLLSTFLSAAEQNRPWGCPALHRFNCFAPLSVCVCVGAHRCLLLPAYCCRGNQLQGPLPACALWLFLLQHPTPLDFLLSCIKVEKRCMLLVTIGFFNVITSYNFPVGPVLIHQQLSASPMGCMDSCNMMLKPSETTTQQQC